MKVWMPYVETGSGSDTFTESLATALGARGHEAVTQSFPHLSQFVPDLLRGVDPPTHCDVIVTNSWNGFAFARQSIPCVTVEHLCVHDGRRSETHSPARVLFHRWFLHSYERRSFEAADLVVVPSRHTKAAVKIAFGIRGTRVIRQGVDVEYFHPRSVERQKEPFRLLFVGNLTRRKGADLLDPIMRDLGPDFVLHYTTNRRQEVEIREGNAHSLGSLDRDQIREAYWNADILLCPTRLESGPLVAMEAMACGLPVVGSTRSSMPETVVDGESGLLRSLEPAAMADAVREIARDPVLRERLSTAARKRAVECFNIEEMVDRYVSLFNELTG